MKLFLCPNLYKSEEREQAARCKEALEKQGHCCALSEEDAECLFGKREKGAAFTVEESDLIVSLGGDGAVLRAAQVAIASGKGLVGINGGRLGFLCVATADQIDHFDEILRWCKPSERFLLEFTYASKTYYAVNDVVIAKNSFGASVDLTVSVEGFGEYPVRGDGIILSTPTGSTAYNHSAGGPILDVASDVIALTPICAHHGNTRTVITKAGNAIGVRERNNTAVIFADGNQIGKICPDFQVHRSTQNLVLYMRRGSHHTDGMS